MCLNFPLQMPYLHLTYLDYGQPLVYSSSSHKDCRLFVTATNGSLICCPKTVECLKRSLANDCSLTLFLKISLGYCYKILKIIELGLQICHSLSNKHSNLSDQSSSTSNKRVNFFFAISSVILCCTQIQPNYFLHFFSQSKRYISYIGIG